MRARHTSIAGDSGSGKTTLLREMMSESNELGIFVNYDSGHVAGIPGRTVTDAAAIVAAVEECDTFRDATQLRFNLPAADMAAGVETAVRAAYTIAERHDARIPVSIYVDESQRIIHDSQALSYQSGYPNALWWCLHEGRDMNIRAVIATQDPQNWNYSPIKNAVNRVWVGPWAVEHKSYLKKFELWEHRNGALDLEEYEYVVFDKQANPVSRGETKERFA